MKLFQKSRCFIWAVALCLVVGVNSLACAAGSESSPALTERDVVAAIEKAEPMIQEITGLSFKERMKFSLVSRSDFQKDMASDFFSILKVLMKDAGEEMASRQAEINAQQISQAALGEYFKAKKVLLMIPDNVSAQVETYEIKNEEFQDFIFLFLAYHMVTVLDEQNFPENNKKDGKVEMNEENAQAARALTQGHAVYVVDMLADKLKISAALKSAALKSYARITDETNPMQQQKLNLIYVKGSEFFKAIFAEKGPSAVKDVLASKSVSMRQILNPKEYLSPTDVKTFDCSKLMAAVTKKLPTEGMQSQSVPLGSTVLSNGLISQGASQQEANSVASECISGAAFTAVKPGQKQSLIIATVMQFSSKEALSNYMALNQKIVESTRKQINSMPNAKMNIVKEEDITLKDFDASKYQEVETKVDTQISNTFSVDGQSGTFYLNVVFVNPEKEQNKESLSAIMNDMNKKRLSMM